MQFSEDLTNMIGRIEGTILQQQEFMFVSKTVTASNHGTIFPRFNTSESVEHIFLDKFYIEINNSTTTFFLRYISH